tara:strand:+ start:374 stop:979 length:606 start_codon:yes stop_codon:yes gene_type:complete
MAYFTGPNIVTDGLVLALDAASERSYPGTGTTWKDLSGNNFDFTIDGSGFSYNTGGWFDMVNGGITHTGTITSNTLCTVVYWIRTTDATSLFLSGPTTNGDYLGAYSSGNKFYNSSNMGTPVLYMNTVATANLYDFIRTGEWIMVEFKNVNLSTFTNTHFNQYTGYTFGNGDLAIMQIYNRSITQAESEQNFNAHKTRFGL